MNTKPELSLVSPLTKNPSPVNQDSDQKKPRLSLVPPLPNAGVNFQIGDFTVNFYDGRYEGETKDGVPHGKGVWILDNDLYRCSYNGCWYEGKRVALGVWKENIWGKSFQSYRGFFDGDNKKRGYGTLVHTKSKLSSRPGRWKYFGMFDNDQMNGYGILVDQSRGFRSRYAGLFRNNRRHGFGVEIFFNDVGEILETIVGQFENNYVTGDVTVTRPDGFVFTGNHDRILQSASPQYFCEGQGVMINSVDSGFLGKFENGLVKGVKWRDIERNHPGTTYVGKRS